MTMFKEFVVNALAPWIPSEFLRGAATALIALLILIVLFWIVSLISYLRGGKRRCNQANIALDGGSLAVSAAAITDAIRGELQGYNQLEVRKINLFRHRKEYILEICCVFHCSDGMGGLPELAGLVKPKLIEKLKTLFGIENLAEINFTVVDFQNGDSPAHR